MRRCELDVDREGGRVAAQALRPDAEQVHRALGFGALADAIADMLRSNPVAPLRHAHWLSSTDSLLLMPAWSDGPQGALGVKLVTKSIGVSQAKKPAKKPAKKK